MSPILWAYFILNLYLFYTQLKKDQGYVVQIIHMPFLFYLSPSLLDDDSFDVVHSADDVDKNFSRRVPERDFQLRKDEVANGAHDDADPSASPRPSSFAFFDFFGHRFVPLRIASLRFASLCFASLGLVSSRSDTLFFFYKNRVYKNIRLQNGLSIKNMLRICQGFEKKKNRFSLRT